MGHPNPTIIQISQNEFRPPVQALYGAALQTSGKIIRKRPAQVIATLGDLAQTPSHKGTFKATANSFNFREFRHKEFVADLSCHCQGSDKACYDI
jgi:hypothetical protein